MMNINVIQCGDEYRVSFPYDPDIIQRVKNVPGRKWHPEHKFWSVPKFRLGFLLSQFKGTEYESRVNVVSEEDIDRNATLDSTQAIPDVDLSGVPFYVKEGAVPFKHQYDFMKYAIYRQDRGNMHGFLLADEQGLSKTAEVINLALYNRDKYNYKHCLIVCCINSAKFTWLNEIDIHTRGAEQGYILGSRRKRGTTKLNYDGSNDQKYQDIESMHQFGKDTEPELPYFLITNIESIRYKTGKQYPIADKIIELIKSGEVNMIAIDEIHKNASPSSLQGKQILRIKKMTGDECMWIPMTGTPITNKPTDVFLPMKLIDAHTYSSYWIWCQNFCIYGGYGDHEIIGYKNISDLKSIVQDNMLRRLKTEVLDLPPKIHYTEYVENTPYQSKLYAQILQEIIADRESIVKSLNPVTKLLRLRQVNGSPELVDPSVSIDKDYIKKNAKLRRLLELLEEIHDRGEKVIIFSNWVEPLRTLYRFINTKYKVCAFTGTMSPQDREHHKELFMSDPEYTVMVGTVGAMGASITLTAANNVIFYDEPWTPADKAQAEDRIHRVGTSSSANIYTLITKDTVDERVNNILYSKQGISKYIVDNTLDIRSNPELFDLITN